MNSNPSTDGLSHGDPASRPPSAFVPDLAATPHLHNAFRDPSSRVSGTFVFIDQWGSTAMKTTQPEASWLPQLGWLYDTITRIFKQLSCDAHLKFLGDGVLISLSSDNATEAINASIQVQEAISDAQAPSGPAMGQVNFNVTIGIATGDAVRFQQDGATDHVGLIVDKARRLCDLANEKAIFVDRATELATNIVKVRSRLGIAMHRTADEYAGDRQSATVKGIPGPIEYYEILWDSQSHGVRNAAVTAMQKAKPDETPPSGPAAPANAPLQPTKSTGPIGGRPTLTLVDRPSGQRATGKVKVVNLDRGWAFVTETSTGEEFFLARKAMHYDEDFAKLATGDEVLFMTAPATTGKYRRAVVALKAGTYADGTLTVLAKGKPYGFITLQDAEGHKHLIYMAVTQATGKFKIGDELSFKVVATAQGARAEDVSLTQDDEGEEPGTDVKRSA